MKEIRIIRISLNSWRGQTREVVFDGKNAVISGRNHSGKSSVMNAFLWCVTGFDSEDRSNYLLFDDRVEQTHENSVPAEVEVTLDVDGENTIIRRVATQGWVRRRGTDTYERNGSDNYTFFVDGVERSAGQFAQDMEYIFGAPKDKLKIMLNLAYFISLDWKAQRKHLGDIIGEVTESDFTDADRFGFIFSDLQRFSIDEIRDKYKALLRPLKESMQRLPIEIETMQGNLPSLEGVEEAKKRKAEIDAEIDSIDRTIADKAAAVSEWTERRITILREISALEESVERGRREYVRTIEDDPELRKLAQERDDAVSANRNIAVRKAQDTLDVDRLKAQRKSLNDKSAWHEKQRADLKAKLEEVKARQFDGGTCPYCKRELPEAMLENAREKFYEALDREKGMIVKQGKDNNTQWEKVKAEIARLESDLAKLVKETYEPQDIAPYDARIAARRAAFPKYEESADYADKMAQIEEKRANLPTTEEMPEDTDLLARKRELRGQSEECVRVMAAESARARQEEIIADRQASLKHTAEELARCEGKVNAIAEYERERAEIIRQRVNNLFGYCQVSMETTDKSGNTVPACIVKDCGGVDFRVTNTASQVKCKCDIAQAFQTFYGVSLPIFIDNCESVNMSEMPVVRGQAIEVRVSENDFNVEL